MLRLASEHDLPQILPRVQPPVGLHGSLTIEREHSIDHGSQFSRLKSRQHILEGLLDETLLAGEVKQMHAGDTEILPKQ